MLASNRLTKVRLWCERIPRPLPFRHTLEIVGTEYGLIYGIEFLAVDPDAAIAIARKHGVNPQMIEFKGGVGLITKWVYGAFCEI